MEKTGTSSKLRDRKGMAVSIAAAVALASLVLLLPLGRKPLTAWDEGIYAEVAREMLGGSWLAPHWNAQLWFEKPPLLMWITAVFFKLVGVNEFAARVASALSGVAIVGLLHAWLLRHGDRLAAWLSTLMLLSTFAFLHTCGLGETDVLLSLGCLIALFGLVRVQAGDGAGWYGFWLGFAVALMTKGAASITLLLALLICLLIERGKLLRFGQAFALGLLLFLALVLPWHLYMLQHFGRFFVREYLGLHVLNRATVQIEGHVTHAWYYLGVLLASAPPWVLLYPFAIAMAFRTPRGSEAGNHETQSGALRVFAVFAFIVIVFFTLVQTRLPHYIAPAYPPLTLVTALYASDKLRALRVPEKPASLKLGWTVAVAAVWGIAALATSAPRKHLHSARELRGAAPPNNRELAELLKASRKQPSLPAGPLLFWTAAPDVPIAPAVFYAQRPVQQVAPDPADLNQLWDKYTYAPESLQEQVGAEPRLLLLDLSLLGSVPDGYAVRPLQVGKSLEVGVISRSADGGRSQDNFLH